jgi:hypothetical protein
MRQARFVKDAVAWLQNNPTPARDVFTHGAPLGSVVVLPLMGADEEPFGALYFAQSAPCDFQNIRGALLVGGAGRERGRQGAGHRAPGARVGLGVGRAHWIRAGGCEGRPARTLAPAVDAPQTATTKRPSLIASLDPPCRLRAWSTA